MKKKLLCARCKKNMSYNGKSLIGLEIEFTASKDFPVVFAKKQLGKHYGKRKFMLCFECFYDNLLGTK